MTEKILAYGLKTSNTKSESLQEIFLMRNPLLARSDDEARHDCSRFRNIPSLLVQMLGVLSQE